MSFAGAALLDMAKRGPERPCHKRRCKCGYFTKDRLKTLATQPKLTNAERLPPVELTLEGHSAADVARVEQNLARFKARHDQWKLQSKLCDDCGHHEDLHFLKNAGQTR